MTSLGIASVKQLRLPLAPPEDEARPGFRREDAPVCLPNLLERVLERSNMFRALRRQYAAGASGGGVACVKAESWWGEFRPGFAP